ncbi:TRAP transporter small permease subunit [Vreelandella sp. EE27]
MMERLENLLAVIFGAIFLALSVLITLEVILRKLFGFSLQGSHELGGYALAVGATLAFTMALFGRNHIRIDIIHERLPTSFQALLNCLASILMAGFAALLSYLAWNVIGDTLDYRSVAQTSWATPLIYPQSIWYAGQAIFMLVAIGLALKSLWLLLSGRWTRLNKDFQPKSAKQELEDELDSVTQRQRGASS